MRAVLYARVSTARQARDDRNSLPVQRQAFAEHCARHGYVPVGEYEDHETGTKITRKGYTALLAASDSFDVIVVTYLDRFGRNDREIMLRVLQLEEAGISIECIYEDVSEFIMLALSAWKAGQESKRIGERVKLATAAAVLKGSHIGQTPYGYTRQDGKLVVYEPHAQVVRDIFRWYGAGAMGFGAVAARLNDLGVPLPPNSRGNLTGKWSDSAVKSILRRGEMYAGTYRWGDVEARCPAIISGDDHALAEEARVRRQRAKGQTSRSEYLLTGIIYCGHCGGRMNGQAVKPKPGSPADQRGVTYPYYICANRRKAHLCEYWNRHRASDLERRVLEAVANRRPRARKKAEDRLPTLVAQLQALDREGEQVARKFRTNLRLYHEGVFGTDEQYADANREIASEQESLKRRRAAVESEIAHLRQVEETRRLREDTYATIRERSQELTRQDLKAALTSVIDRVTIFEHDPLPRVRFH